jgi:hypothetical protein
MARPTKKNPKGLQKKPKFTEETIKKLKDAFGFYASIEQACFYAGITEPTYYSWRNNNEKLFKEIEAFRLRPKLKAKFAVVNSFELKPEIAFRFLERVEPDFIPKEKVETKGEIDHTFELVIKKTYAKRNNTDGKTN